MFEVNTLIDYMLKLWMKTFSLALWAIMRMALFTWPSNCRRWPWNLKYLILDGFPACEFEHSYGLTFNEMIGYCSEKRGSTIHPIIFVRTVCFKRFVPLVNCCGVDCREKSIPFHHITWNFIFTVVRREAVEIMPRKFRHGWMS